MRKKLILVALALLGASAMEAKSLVLTLADRHATRVYYQLGTGENPRLVIARDGTFTLGSREYTFEGVTNFFISQTDYTGEKNTEDAIVSIDADGRTLMNGPVRVYTLDGRLAGEAQDGRFALQGLKAGTYVITNGQSTLKVQKR